LLECGYEALHGAALRRPQLQGSDGGTFVGMEHPDWHSVKGLLDLGDTVSVASGRLSFVLGMHGPCKTVDTACTSGLCAAHGAAAAARSSEAAFALGAASSLKLRPHATLALVAAGTVSTDGRCKTFDARANGYARAEAVSAASLRMAAAASFGAMVATIVVRHDGRSASLTAPNGSAQRMLSAVWATIADGLPSCIEAHGTGTALGDPTELGALVASNASRGGRTDGPTDGLIPIGSHKANIGHAEAPSGLMGLLSASSRLTQHELYANAQLRRVNPVVAGAMHGVSVPLPLSTLAGGTVGRMAGRMAGRMGRLGCGVTGMGHSGTLAHAVLAFGCAVGAADASISTRAAGQTPLLAYRRRAFLWRGPSSASTSVHPSVHPSLLSAFSPRAPSAELERIDADTPLMQAGVTSLAAVRLASRLRALTGWTDGWMDGRRSRRRSSLSSRRRARLPRTCLTSTLPANSTQPKSRRMRSLR
jgi:acyl transferase domain-containing protein